jgi:hypothetical protein
MHQHYAMRMASVNAALTGMLLSCAVSVQPVQAITWTQTESDGFESGNFSGWDGTSVSDGTVSVLTTNPNSGTYHLRARLDGADDAGATDYARVQWTLPNYTTGDLIASEFYMYTTSNMWADRNCTFQPFGWDTFPTLGKQMRIMVYLSDGLARVVKVQGGTTTEMTGTFDMDNINDWTLWRVEMKILDTGGWVKVYKDGVEVASGSNKDTDLDSVMTRSRYGFADCSGQDIPLNVYMDDIKHFEGAE